jgi:DNA-directed RNA polymerase subunit RPC12/RpoP
MKILLFDVEVSPNLATVWGIFNQNIGINQLLETSKVMCFAAKWVGEKGIIFDNEYESGHKNMVKHIYSLLNDADAVVTYNGDRFDLKVMNREFLKYNIPPPDGVHSIDLLKVVKKRFRFVSNKLDHITQELNIGEKVKHEGHELWIKCMNGDKKAWKDMEKYNKMDVILLDRLYHKLLPWIKNHPNYGLYTEQEHTLCPNCGSTHIVKNGVETTQTMAYQRYRCQDCKTPLRGRTNLLTKEKRESIITQSKV